VDDPESSVNTLHHVYGRNPVSNPFDEESDAAKDDLDLGGEDEFAAKSGGDVESRSGGDVESLAADAEFKRSGGDVESRSGGDVESTGGASQDSGGDVESEPSGDGV
jgi:hypothetical protein